MLPCLIFEDEHLLAVNKPAGWNTHAPSPYAGEGIYDWLRHREPRWAGLSIIHRLDKETSGVMVFGKSPAANRSLTAQFTRREVHKKYLFLTDRAAPARPMTVKSALVRAGERYLSRPPHAGGEVAETRFRLLEPRAEAGKGGPALNLVEAEPLTGRTHQIRVHAAEHGFPILGDTLYGGTPAARVCLHAAELVLAHPATGQSLTFRAEADFQSEPRAALRAALIEPDLTTAWRVIHGASDGWPGWHVERLGDYLLSQSETSAELSGTRVHELERLRGLLSSRGVYHKTLTRRVRQARPAETSPRLIFGEAAPERFEIRENGLRYELSFGEGYSVGLFLDQRDNRRRLLTGHVAAGFDLFDPARPAKPEFQVLNTFAYTCGFSVCAAKAGARTTSLDLSKKYLDWGGRNFVLNGIDPASHNFIFGDVFDWLRRLAKKGRSFDLILLDPPTFSQSKESGVFRVEKDYGRLVGAALPLLGKGGVLFASTNAAEWPAELFLSCLDHAAGAAGRRILARHYVPQPPDFPVSRAEPAYLKTTWLRVD